jgi:hypothetical protein
MTTMSTELNTTLQAPVAVPPTPAQPIQNAPTPPSGELDMSSILSRIQALEREKQNMSVELKVCRFIEEYVN